ncbi:hypothetical protein Pst134EA_007784 [Puccinia striiformis f. sp. tritici]|uniref:hypothetical protein n=1 Tax=Puccinia striiformis f. sp. tritici TaxID=168172 RepID=UPI002008CF27|nr:hypothetical protein Pst134EA_007784 [Puccinia striiformis f. sp. tritici]KAH9470535.1 hypothetical protein Pst134EA_007784 [Puccinia striiformis f. sp. tritici]KAI9610896.1 hypothetical protein H4Q26_008741 [Puccinia striiformis f. sp. tritici PST-130]
MYPIDESFFEELTKLDQKQPFLEELILEYFYPSMMCVNRMKEHITTRKYKAICDEADALKELASALGLCRVKEMCDLIYDQCRSEPTKDDHQIEENIQILERINQRSQECLCFELDFLRY